MTSRHQNTVSSPDRARFKASVLESMGTIHLTQSFTVTEAESFRASCQQAFERHPNLEEVVLDFADTRFIDSSGIGSLVICHKLCESKGAKLRLISVPEQVMMALSLTELDKVFHIERLPVPVEEPVARARSLSKSQTVKRDRRLTGRLQSAVGNLPGTHPSVRSKPKRALDIVGGLVGLFLTAILFVVVGIIIKLDDGGPIFFAQTRCSFLGKRFKIWKFRSMVVDAEARKKDVANKVEGPLFKNDNDPRITKIGKFLRKTSLDEFPQFWNVVKGDMSLVGTRPPTPDEIEKYEVSQWQRLNVKPGMTGEWQVHGRSTVTSFEDVIQLDLQYQRKWSLMYDIKLIVKTVMVLFSKDSGAM